MITGARCGHSNTEDHRARPERQISEHVGLSQIMAERILKLLRTAHHVNPPQSTIDQGQSTPCSAPGFYPTQRQIGRNKNIVLGPDGTLYFTQRCTNQAQPARIMRLRTERIRGARTVATSPDARERYDFDAGGKHQRTRSQSPGRSCGSSSTMAAAGSVRSWKPMATRP